MIPVTIRNLPQVAALAALDSPRTSVLPSAGRAAEIDAYWRDALAAEEVKLDAMWPLAPRPGRADDGKGRKVSVTALREGDRLWAPDGVASFGRGGSVSPGSFCVVTRVESASIVHVEFADAETGEVLRGDVMTTEVRWPVGGAR